MVSLADLLIVLILLSIWYIIIIINDLITKYKQKELIKQQLAIKKLEEIKQQEKIKKLEEIKQQQIIEEEEKEEEKEYTIICDEILLLIMVEYLNNKQEPINKLINKIINKYKHTDKLDKNTDYNFNDIFNDASSSKQVDLIKLIFSLNNIKNKQYLSDNIFIGEEQTFDELVVYAIKNNICELFEFAFESKSCKINEEKYNKFEKIIKNNEIYLLFIKHKLEDEYHNTDFD